MTGKRSVLKINMLQMVAVSLCLIFFQGNSSHSVELPDDESDKGILAIFYPIKSTVISAEVSSTVKAIRHDMGQVFKKGEMLIVLDSDNFKAEKNKADANQVFSAAVFQSKKELFGQKSVSMMEYSKAESDYKISKANSDIAGKKLDACMVRAPYAGKVVKLLVKENEFVTEGRPLVEIMDDRMIQVKFHVPSSLLKQFKIGQVYNIRVNSIKPLIKCKITHISPIIESNTSSFQVFGLTGNPNGTIRAGMTGFITMN
jgi:RND family efflux transporter MFP subunit